MGDKFSLVVAKCIKRKWKLYNVINKRAKTNFEEAWARSGTNHWLDNRFER